MFTVSDVFPDILVHHHHHHHQAYGGRSDWNGRSRALHHTLDPRPGAVVRLRFDPQRLTQHIIHIYCTDGTGAEVRLEVWRERKTLK